MSRFLFLYPWEVYRKGQLVLLSGSPVWVLGALAAVAAAVLGWMLWRRHAALARGRWAALWLLQWSMAAALLLLLWRPALSVTSLKPQQNVVAVVIDDSRSMNQTDGGQRRLDDARRLLRSGLLDSIQRRYPVRLYRTAEKLQRIESLDSLTAGGSSTRLGESLKSAMAESATLPIGAVVLLSDGADNSGGLDPETTAELRRYRIPVFTVGLGGESLVRDVEISDVQLPARALPESRLSALVTFRHSGFSGRTAKLMVRDGAKVLASRDVALPEDGSAGSETISFPVGAAGAKTVRVSLDPIDGERNLRNNSVPRMINVETRKPRVLYYEGEPRWEFKFIRRAMEADRNLELVTILRTTPNKIYRQGINNPKELEEGFPGGVDELFGFDGIIIGAVEAGSLTAVQQDLLKRFADRRGGGILFLGGRTSFADGAWRQSPLAEILPVALPDRKLTFRREPAKAELTAAGQGSMICRLDESPEKNAERWKSLPLLADYQDVGEAKPGAAVLSELTPASGGRYPLLVTQNYGRGRVATLATGGTWRWRMLRDSKDAAHERFWQQLVRWLVFETPGRVSLTSARSVYSDEKRIPVSVEVRDRNYQPAGDAILEAHVAGPAGFSASLSLTPDPLNAGVFTGEFHAEASGAYVVEALARQDGSEAGRGVLTLLREDGVAEDFRTEQNRELLQRIAEQTGGRYHTPASASALPGQIALSDAGISVRENLDLWNVPAVFFTLLGLRAAEWLLRRRWGAV